MLLKLKLNEHVTFPTLALQAIANGVYPAQRTIPIEQSGLKRNIKSDPPSAWKEHKNVILHNFMLYSQKEEDFQINWIEAVKFTAWMDQGYSIAALLRMRLAMDPTYSIPQNVRWALQIYESLIKRDGMIWGSSGHTILPVPELLKQIASTMPLGYHASQDHTEDDEDKIAYTMDQAGELLNQLCAEGYLIFDSELNAVYVPGYSMAESLFVKALNAPYTPETPPPETPPPPTADGLELDKSQGIAYVQILNRKTAGVVLAGYPGAGKTHECKYICKHYGPENVLALATTGAAAMVLSRQLHLKSHTISSAYYNQINPNFQHYLRKKVYIIDECSMLNMAFLKQLLSLITIYKPTTILMTGDPTQLPPVGAGCIYSALVNHQIATDIPICVLTQQHRMTPEDMSVLKLYGTSLDYKTVANQSYPSRTIPMMGNAMNWPIGHILEFFANGCVVKGLSIDQRTSVNRLLLSTYRNKDAQLLSMLIEAYRCRENTKVAPLRTAFIDQLNNYIVKVLAYENNVASFPRSLSKPNGAQLAKYLSNSLLDHIIKPRKVQYHDELEQLEQDMAVTYQALKNELKYLKYTKGGYYRANKNGWFADWPQGRAHKTQAEWGIRVVDNKSIANGQIFTAIADKELYCVETDTRVHIVEPDKAAKVFTISWVSTTHKLQGDQGAKSVYFHLSTSAETKLIYVALSRGTETNTIIQNITTSTGWNATKNKVITCNDSVDRLSVLAQLSKKEKV
jgi:hypothetical protein